MDIWASVEGTVSSQFPLLTFILLVEPHYVKKIFFDSLRSHVMTKD